MPLDYNNLFEGIKESLQKERQQAQGRVSFDKVLKLHKPKNGQTVNEYMFRILPYIKEGKEGLHKTFFYFASYFWQDEVGRWISVLSRKTFGEPCAISDYYYNVRRNGTEYEKENLDRRLKYKQGWYCNVYVVSDPVNPSNNGKVMVLPLNKTLWTLVQKALNGELDAEWSARMTDANPTGEEVHVNVGRMVTDLTNNGVNLDVRVTSKGQFPDYSSSDFTRREARLNLTEQQQDEILNQCVDVTKIEKELSAEQILKVFKETFLMQTSLYNTTPATEQVHEPVREATHNVQAQAAKSLDDIFGNDQVPLSSTSIKEEKPAANSVESEMDSFISGLAGKGNSFNFG